MTRPRFGEQRLVRQDVGALGRAAFRLLGVADPAHWLHFDYLRRSLDGWSGFAPRAILDAGCGRGDFAVYLARRYPRATVVGIDVSESLITRNREGASRLGLTNLEFAVADLTTIEWSGRFDLVISIDVLEHIERQTEALARLKNALEPGGRYFFHIPTIRKVPVPLSRWLGGFHEWAEREHVADDLTAEQFAARVQAAGLRVDLTRPTFGYFAGELATSLFALPYSNSPVNRVLQLGLAPICRGLAHLDRRYPGDERFAVLVSGHRELV